MHLTPEREFLFVALVLRLQLFIQLIEFVFVELTSGDVERVTGDAEVVPLAVAHANFRNDLVTLVAVQASVVGFAIDDGFAGFKDLSILLFGNCAVCGSKDLRWHFPNDRGFIRESGFGREATIHIQVATFQILNEEVYRQ